MKVLLFGPGHALYVSAYAYDATARGSLAITASASLPRKSPITSGAAPYHSASGARRSDTEIAVRPLRRFQPITS